VAADADHSHTNTQANQLMERKQQRVRGILGMWSYDAVITKLMEPDVNRHDRRKLQIQKDRIIARQGRSPTKKYAHKLCPRARKLLHQHRPAGTKLLKKCIPQKYDRRQQT